MANHLVSGGTDGVGRAVALDALANGHHVVVVGSTQAKGDAFLTAADQVGAAGRATFLRADLRLMSENSRVVDAVRARFDRLDRLVLCAQRYLTRLGHTVEGIERNFALTYLSRFALTYGLLPHLRRADRPLVVNVCGTGTPAGRIRWNDLQFRAGGGGLRALAQAGRATDLLGVAFARRPDTRDIPYVLFNPDVVRTNLQRELGYPWRLFALAALALRGKPVEEGVAPLLRLLADPPAERLSAFRGTRPVRMASRLLAPGYDPAEAARLYTETERLLSGMGRVDLLP
ncbi:SDR family NAD(P)-dependent oxidoreductase [Plantactinospora sp. WMMC1484]|uniref:SDR family NAD(P)-dependent oxidoreductase n=1 Tax=Plantactinospora sp. WMMC1484 TaxID=3404122 RepID=UPI003BF4BBCB